jgi:methionyl-tRNA formyltransferase
MLMNRNSYAGREYLSKLLVYREFIKVASIGNYPEINVEEDSRCGGLWNPIEQSVLEKYFTFYNFSSLKDENLVTHLDSEKYDLCIQGGTGIIKNNLLDKFKFGILNFHPGDLPNYCGCSAPEWQLFEGNQIVCTCHLIDSGIDTGPILKKEILKVNKSNYESFRASIYPETAKFVLSIIEAALEDNSILINYSKQDKSLSNYRKYIGIDNINLLKSNYFNS